MSDANDAFDRLADHEVLSPGQVNVLARLAAGGDRAAHAELVASNVRLVISIAHRLRDRLESVRGFDFDDLVQEGMIGLNKAVAYFDPDRGFRFSTYATFAINQRMNQALTERGNTIHVPLAVSKLRLQIDAILKQGGPDSAQDLAAALHTGVEKIDAARNCAYANVSLDASISAESEITRAAFIGSNDTIDQDETRLSAATDADLELLSARFLDKRSRSEVAEALGLSDRQATRRVSAAITRLGTPPGSCEFASPAPARAADQRRCRKPLPPSEVTVKKAFAELSPRSRALLGRFLESGGDYDLLASTLGVTSQSAQQRVTRAFYDVRRGLETPKALTREQLAGVVLAERAWTRSVVERLVPSVRETMRLRLLDGNTRAEVAATTGIPIAKVIEHERKASRLSDALARQTGRRASVSALLRLSA